MYGRIACPERSEVAFGKPSVSGSVDPEEAAVQC